MADLSFRISPNIILGSYTTTRLSQYVKPYGSRFLLIIDPDLKDFAVADKISQTLSERNVEFITFDHLTDGSNTKELEQALSLARNSHVQGILAVGGSKALLVSAAVSALFNEKKDLYEYVDGLPSESEPLPMISIPTTMRAPYSFTNKIPVMDSRTRQIKLLHIQNNICKLMIWDPNFFVTLTENQQVSMALETFCIATEAYISQKANFFSDMFTEKAVELMGYGLDGAKSLDISTPSEVLLAQAGCMASLASSSSSIGVASLAALAVNARYSISRSLVASILFPYIIEDAGKYKCERIERIGHLFGVVDENTHREEAVQAFAENIRQRLAKVNLPTRLKDLNITMEQLAIVAEDAGTLEPMNTLARSMTTDDFFDFLKQAY